MAGHGRGQQGTVENSRRYRKTVEHGGRRKGTAGDDEGRWEMVGEDTILSILVLGLYLSGRFRKRQDRTMKFPPCSSLPRKDRLPYCEHCQKENPVSCARDSCSKGTSALVYGCSYSKHCAVQYKLSCFVEMDVCGIWFVVVIVRPR